MQPGKVGVKQRLVDLIEPLNGLARCSLVIEETPEHRETAIDAIVERGTGQVVEQLPNSVPALPGQLVATRGAKATKIINPGMVGVRQGEYPTRR